MSAQNLRLEMLPLSVVLESVRGGFAAGACSDAKDRGTGSEIQTAESPAPQTHSGKLRPGDWFVLLPPNRPGEKGGLDYLAQVLLAESNGGSGLGGAVQNETSQSESGQSNFSSGGLVYDENDGPEVFSLLGTFGYTEIIPFSGAAQTASGSSSAARSGRNGRNDGNGSSANNSVLRLCPVRNVRQALGLLAAAYYGTEHYHPKLVGITGTNGKTTSAYLLEHLFTAAGHRVGVLGTISYRWPGFNQAAPLTTPGCLELHGLFAKMQQASVDTVVMEVSSHALDQERIAGLSFSGALFCNLTQDHLDYHQSMEEYFKAKARLFVNNWPGPASAGGAVNAANAALLDSNSQSTGQTISQSTSQNTSPASSVKGAVPQFDKARAINVNDEFGVRLYGQCRALPGTAVAFGLLKAGGWFACGEYDPNQQQVLAGELLRVSPDGLRLRMRYNGAQWELNSPLVGEFNAMNLLGVQAMALSLGLKPEAMRTLENFTGVPGRLERVLPEGGRRCANSAEAGFENRAGLRPSLNCFVDYAHTPDALIKAINALRAAGFERIITVFGCGGNRDRGKRPLMGEAVCRYADVAVLTSDNPRNEDPQSIMDDVMPGLQIADGRCREVHCEPDRKSATGLAFALLRPGDALLVAGKGHEDYQIIGTEKIHYSDQQVLRELLK